MRPRTAELPYTGTTLAPTGSAPANAPLHSVRGAAHAAVRVRELWAGLHLSGFDSVSGLEQLAMRAQRFTPRVSLVPPDGLLLELAGSLHLFGGLAGLRRALTDECQPLQVRPVLAFAPTPLAALTAARAGQPLMILDPAQLTGQLAPLPLSALRWPEETRARLARAGVRTIGAVLRLPRAGFARRFGVAQLALLDALTGRTRDVRADFHAPLRFRRRRELDCELSDHGRLLAALAPLFDALGTFLIAHQRGVVELECRFVHRNALPTHCVLSLAAPCANGQQLAALFGERLNSLPLPEPVRALELWAEELLPQRSPCRALWQPGERGGEAREESEGLIDRLCARLGPEAVRGLAQRPEHRPENAWVATRPPAATQHRVSADRAADEVNETPARPLWLLPAPQLLAARNGLPHRHGPLRLLSEPERIETGWWDGGEIARDYYTALDRHGVRLWVFREREPPHAWFLHGVFG
jgi:protein ImuB